MPTVLKDGLVGAGIGTAAIIPGISGATIALIFGSFKKIVNAAGKLFSKQFLKNLLILLPFGIGLLIAVAALIKPFQLAFEYCMFAIICLFAAFIIGSLPGIVDNVRGQKPTKINIVVLIVSIIIAVSVGVLSIVFDLSNVIQTMFNDGKWYLYVILFALGIIAATGVTVPGFSASLLLLATGFYYPILNCVHFDFIKNNPGKFFGIIGVFFVGIFVGFFLWSKLMSFLLDKHKQSTHYAVLGFILGFLVSIFANSQMVGYIKGAVEKENGMLLDIILTPIFVAIGIIVAYTIVRYSRKHKNEETVVEE